MALTTGKHLSYQYMKTEEYIAIGTLISVISGSLALVIKQVEQSRCTKIKCCGLACDRTPPPDPDSENPRNQNVTKL
jgi:hypothetical protein